MDTTQWPTEHDERSADGPSTVDDASGGADHYREALFRWGYL